MLKIIMATFLLAAQLDDACRFLGGRNRNRHDSRTLRLPRIFWWYREDLERGWDGLYSLPRFLANGAHSMELNDADVQRLSRGEIRIELLITTGG